MHGTVRRADHFLGIGQEPGQPTGLTLNLASNNPFRKHTTSPVNGAVASKPTSPTSPFDDPPPRPVSRNPFLDPGNKSAPPPIPPDAMSTKTDSKPGPSAEELFDSLTLEDKTPTGPDGLDAKRPMNRPPGRPPPGPPRPGQNMPARPGGPPGHRPTKSQEEAMRARRMQPGGPGPKPGPSSSPHKRTERRPRRNSESSVLDNDKNLTEEEKKLKEARRKERERKYREAKEKLGRPNRRLDVIDKLDATSIYGIGAFHHDGPFDACNPNRNRQGSRRAPMQAFAKDSLNNSIGGAGPLNKRPDHAVFMGNADEEAFKDYASSGKIKNGYNFPNQSRGELSVFDPMSRGSILHGDQSLGLGTSTFLEGTPAPQTAIQRREAERAAEIANDGLQRKKSLAQRIRSINRGPREHPSGRLTSPDGVYSSRRSPDTMPPATMAGAIGGDRSNERNPFFAEYTDEPETLSVKRTEPTSPRSPTSPGPQPSRMSGGGLERRMTGDATATAGGDEQGKPGGGLLARVKSLKGGRKPRNQPASPPNAPASLAPGTAV